MILYFDEEHNVVSQKEESEVIISETNSMNVESTATSRPPYEVHYPESSMRTMDYGQGHPPRREVLLILITIPCYEL